MSIWGVKNLLYTYFHNSSKQERHNHPATISCRHCHHQITILTSTCPLRHHYTPVSSSRSNKNKNNVYACMRACVSWMKQYCCYSTTNCRIPHIHLRRKLSLPPGSRRGSPRSPSLRQWGVIAMVVFVRFCRTRAVPRVPFGQLDFPPEKLQLILFEPSDPSLIVLPQVSVGDFGEQHPRESVCRTSITSCPTILP